MSAVLVTAYLRPLPPRRTVPLPRLGALWAKAQTGKVFSCFGLGCQCSLPGRLRTGTMCGDHSRLSMVGLDLRSGA